MISMRFVTRTPRVEDHGSRHHQHLAAPFDGPFPLAILSVIIILLLLLWLLFNRRPHGRASSGFHLLHKRTKTTRALGPFSTGLV
jgi:hypothetical protein